MRVVYTLEVYLPNNGEPNERENEILEICRGCIGLLGLLLY